MSNDIVGGAIAAAGMWVILAAGIMGLTPSKSHDHIWVVTGSEMIRSHPDLVRATTPNDNASRLETGGGRGLIPEG
jgi:hypothetical protein